MDSLTQLTFGAACGEAILGQKVGRKALVWGAVLGTLPDLDVFIPLGSPVDDFVYHRGFSHSLFVLAVLSPMIAWLISKIHPDTKRYYRGWVLLALLVLEASVLLDLLTIYGTQIFWPFDTTPMALPVLFNHRPAVHVARPLGRFGRAGAEEESAPGSSTQFGWPDAQSGLPGLGVRCRRIRRTQAEGKTRASGGILFPDHILPGTVHHVAVAGGGHR